MGKIIVNGGQPLEGCPESPGAAELWVNEANKTKSAREPRWSFDCGFKLDFDGALLRISSRFYPPKEYYGKTWDGEVTIYLSGEEVSVKKFDERTLEELRVAVETYLEEVTFVIRDTLKEHL